MIETTVPMQWLRRYKIFVFVALLFIQLLLGYLLPMFGKSDDGLPKMYAASSAQIGTLNHQQINNHNPDVNCVNRLNSIPNSGNEQHQKQQQQAQQLLINSNLKLGNLKFKPICDIQAKEAISAVLRAQTQLCKETIINITCAIQNGQFYSKSLPNYCPHEPYIENRSLGCFKDDKEFRTLSGYYINFKQSNTPRKCVQLCLQSGFVYAGMEYSTECFCGNTISEKTTKVPDPECNHKCSGNPKELCGGYFTISIFETGIKQFVPRVAEVGHKIDSSVRIAFLLTLNGRAVRQVHRLLKLLYSEQNYYFIHVDARQDYMYSELLKLEQNTNNIRLARKRYSTIWGGASLLRMLLASMTELLNESNWKWEFIINLSESDFLIKSKENLISFLTANRDRNFVRSHGREVQSFIKKQGLDKSFVECDTHMWRIGERNLPYGIQIDGGSDWVALSRSFVHYVTTNENEQDDLLAGLLRIFNHTLLPAESFFHTVLRNSKYCNSYVDNNLHVTNWKRRLGCRCQYKHVVDWCGCSPNDFKIADWPRLLATETKQLFFARKFEPIVNQAIILRLEEWIIGPYPNDYPNLNSYWQNVFSSSEKLTNIDEALITVASSLACQKLNLNYTMNAIDELHTFMEFDQYKGFLIRYKIGNVIDKSEIIQLELLARPQQFGKVSRTLALGKRIKNIEVSTEYDQKEQILRNFAKIMGPYAEPTLVIHVSAADIPSNLAASVAATNYNLTALWINPAGHLNDISDIYVDASNPLQTISFVKSSLQTPLLPGIWTVKLIFKQSLIGQCNFLIVPKINGDTENVNLDAYRLDAQTISQQKSPLHKHWNAFLPNEHDRQVMEQRALLNAKLIDDEQIIWISQLINKFFTIKDYCIVQQSSAFPKLNECHQTNWSSLAPDPKSDLFTIDGINKN